MKEYKRLKIMTVCLVVILAVIMLATPALAAVLVKGDTGSKVTKIQERLKLWGYYNGAVDGIFGSSTEAAVKFFQRRNGLVVDGVIGTATGRALGVAISSSSSGTTSSEVNLLSHLVYAEARGEPYTGKVAVAAVVLNRVDSSQFPNTISGVIYQPGAFSCINDGQINLTPDNDAIRAAKDALNGWDPSGGAIFYYNPSIATDNWIRTRTIISRIGGHVFAV